MSSVRIWLLRLKFPHKVFLLDVLFFEQVYSSRIWAFHIMAIMLPLHGGHLGSNPSRSTTKLELINAGVPKRSNGADL